MVDKYYGGRVEATAFKVADAAMAGNGPAGPLHTSACPGHRRGPGTDRGGPGSQAAHPGQGGRRAGSSAQIAKQLGMQPWLVEQAQRDVRRWTPEGLVRSIQVTAEADAQVKGSPGIPSTLWSMPSR